MRYSVSFGLTQKRRKTQEEKNSNDGPQTFHLDAFLPVILRQLFFMITVSLLSVDEYGKNNYNSICHSY